MAESRCQPHFRAVLQGQPANIAAFDLLGLASTHYMQIITHINHAPFPAPSPCPKPVDFLASLLFHTAHHSAATARVIS